MPRYTDDSRERVRAAVDMVDLVQTRTELKRAGPGRWSGRCCFHEERSPSLSVDAERKLYHCFGCQAGGDLFTFVQETEGTDFTGALEFLASRYGVTLDVVDDDPASAARRKREQQLLGLVERAAKFYERSLWQSQEAAAARDYLLGRGLTEEALKTYRVGWAPDAWDRLVAASEKGGVKPRDLAEAGLAMPRKDGRGFNDRFRGRITFPLCDGQGRVRGFGARAMQPEQKPKYLNTSENALFSKGRQLFGLHLARAAAARSGVVVLVEGYTDVLALHQIGVAHAVALMGTAMTAEQVQELSRLAPLLVLALDPDGAGEAAMERAAELAQGSRLEVRVATLPDARDPADLVQAGRSDELKAALDRPVHMVRFRVERILRSAPLTTGEERDEALADLAPIVAGLGEGALREELVGRIADRMGLGPAIVDRVVRSAPAERPGRSQQQRGASGRGAGAGRGGISRGTSGGGGAPSPARWQEPEPQQPNWDDDEEDPLYRSGPSARGDARGDGFRARAGREHSGPGGYPGRGGPPQGGGQGSRREDERGGDDNAPGRRRLQALDPQDEQERSLLALMVGLGPQGREALAELDLDDLRVPAVREVAAWLKAGGDADGAMPEDPRLADVARDVMLRVERLEPRPALLEVELAQLALRRLQLEATKAMRRGDPVEGIREAVRAARERLDAAFERSMSL